MKILFCSHVFAPSVGGTETVGKLLAEEFSAAGHEVQVVTRTPGETTGSFAIHRRPSQGELLDLTRWADLVFHNNISARAAWPLMLARKPWVITHHTWLADRRKSALLRFARNIAISTAIAQALPVPSIVIPDPYDAGTFFVRRGVPRDRDIVFVGRLVSDKGGDLLLDALAMLGDEQCTVTIIGDGPERSKLQARAGGNIRFTGMLPPDQVAAELNRHRICVVPSRWNEPFGVVALEAIACGCAVIASLGGGLPEAVGRCGRLFKNGDVRELAGLLREMLRHGTVAYTRHAEAHLKFHHPGSIAQKYLQVFDEAVCVSG